MHIRLRIMVMSVLWGNLMADAWTELIILEIKLPTEYSDWSYHFQAIPLYELRTLP